MSTEGTPGNAPQLPMQASRNWLRGIVYAACGAAFLADVSYDDTVAFGVFYIPLVGTAIYHRDPRAAWWLAILATGLVVIGFVIPWAKADVSAVAINRLLSIAAIFATACLVRHERRIRDRLIEQTARAQVADRAKRQIFANLSHELRTPLAAILGFADLLLADARPQQRVALGHIMAGGRRLLATVDNLIDLAHLEDRPLRSRPMDVAAPLRLAVDAAAAAAMERQITLTLTVPDAEIPSVRADLWAFRRIIDNLIANGIKFTEPGGSVHVSCRRGPADCVTVAITDTGAGMLPAVLRQLGEPFFQADTGLARRFEGLGTGLALSLRLAEIMGARIAFDSHPGDGTTVTLTLPDASS